MLHLLSISVHRLVVTTPSYLSASQKSLHQIMFHLIFPIQEMDTESEWQLVRKLTGMEPPNWKGDVIIFWQFVVMFVHCIALWKCQVTQFRMGRRWWVGEWWVLEEGNSLNLSFPAAPIPICTRAPLQHTVTTVWQYCDLVWGSFTLPEQCKMSLIINQGYPTGSPWTPVTTWPTAM